MSGPPARPAANFKRARRAIIGYSDPSDQKGGALRIRQHGELVEHACVGCDLDSLDRRKPFQDFFQGSRVVQLLLRGEGMRVGMTAYIPGPGQVAVDMRQQSLAIARQKLESVRRQRLRLAD